MKLVTLTGGGFSRHGGIGSVLNVISESGFDGADLSMYNMQEQWITDNSAYRKEVSQSVLSTGIEIRQAHAPFPGKRYGDEAYNAVYDKAVRLAIATAASLGAHTIVVHPIYCPTLTAKEQMDYNLEYYQSLQPLARQEGIRIALENMFRGGTVDRFFPNVCSLPDEFSRYYDALDSKIFTCCLDIGHFAMLGVSPASAIKEMGSGRVGALHVHDNDLMHDCHNPPYTGKIDWEEVAKALADIGYKGDFTFEAEIADRLPTPLLKAGHAMLAQTGRYLISRIAHYQNEANNT